MRPSRRSKVTDDLFPAERRSQRRYAIHLPFSGAVWDQDWRAFEGTTVDISSHGILLATPEAVPVGACARIVIDWPAAAGERKELEIAVKVVWTSRNLVAAQLWSHHFQSTPLNIAVGEVNACRN